MSSAAGLPSGELPLDFRVRGVTPAQARKDRAPATRVKAPPAPDPRLLSVAHPRSCPDPRMPGGRITEVKGELARRESGGGGHGVIRPPGVRGSTKDAPAPEPPP